MTAPPTPDGTPESLRAARAVEARPLPWWGMVLWVAVAATMYAAMYFSYVYIRIGVSRWPPPGIEPPALGLATLSAGALVASAVALWSGIRRVRRHGLGAERSGLLVAVVLAGGHGAALAADWARAGFAVDVHSYAALYYTLPAVHLSALAVAVLTAAVHLALSFRPAERPRRAVGLEALALYWSFLAVGGTGLLAVVYLTPHVWPRL